MYGRIVVVLRGPLDVDSHGLMEGRYGRQCLLATITNTSCKSIGINKELEQSKTKKQKMEPRWRSRYNEPEKKNQERWIGERS